MNASAKINRLPVSVDNLIKVLVEQRRALVAAQSDEALLDRYGALIRFLRGATAQELGRIFPEHGYSLKLPTAQEPELSEAEVANMPRAEVERLVTDESTTRRQLERIAILRFHVPRGSMRRFSNREMLIDKLSTLLRNEQAHSAIEEVARGQGELLPGIGLRTERRAQGDYAVRQPNSQRASEVVPTQREAIERAHEVSPNRQQLVERVRYTDRGKPDRWRKP